ncbi:MAG: XkdX family protein [Firmicutes bacterium]|nr:XkdX family protein [Bacillota bacterium]
MRTLVESLKRLYKKGKVTKEKLQSMVEEGTITEAEYEYITGESYV